MSPKVVWLSGLLHHLGMLNPDPSSGLRPNLCAFASLREIFLNGLGAVSPTRMRIRE
jgi:hypothetical protein